MQVRFHGEESGAPSAYRCGPDAAARDPITELRRAIDRLPVADAHRDARRHPREPDHRRRLHGRPTAASARCSPRTATAAARRCWPSPAAGTASPAPAASAARPAASSRVLERLLDASLGTSTPRSTDLGAAIAEHQALKERNTPQEIEADAPDARAASAACARAAATPSAPSRSSTSYVLARYSLDRAPISSTSWRTSSGENGLVRNRSAPASTDCALGRVRRRRREHDDRRPRGPRRAAQPRARRRCRPCAACRCRGRRSPAGRPRPRSSASTPSSASTMSKPATSSSVVAISLRISGSSSTTRIVRPFTRPPRAARRSAPRASRRTPRRSPGRTACPAPRSISARAASKSVAGR